MTTNILYLIYFSSRSIIKEPSFFLGYIIACTQGSAKDGQHFVGKVRHFPKSVQCTETVAPVIVPYMNSVSVSHLSEPR